MASTSRRAVVTGIGMLTPVGLSHDAVWQALRSGASGVRRLQTFDTSALPIHIAGEIVGFDAHTGKRLGGLTTPAPMQTPPLLQGDTLYVGLRDRSLVALRLPSPDP